MATTSALQRVAAELLRQRPSDAQLEAMRDTVLALPGLSEAHDRMALGQAEASAETSRPNDASSLRPVQRLTDPRVAFAVWESSSSRRPVVFRTMLNAQALGRLNREYLLSAEPDGYTLDELRDFALSLAPPRASSDRPPVASASRRKASRQR